MFNQNQTELRIFKTKDYGRFNFLENNRKIHLQHLSKIRESIRKSGFSEDGAILCYKKGDDIFVLDGQHRFEAARQLNVDVKYTLVNESEAVQKIIEKNTYQKQWVLEDYLNFFCGLNIKSYQILREFYRENKIPLSIAINLLGGSRNMSHIGGDSKFRMSPRQSYKKGDLYIDEESLSAAQDGINKANKIRYFSERYSVFNNDRHFLNAVYKFVTSKKYDEGKMIDQLAMQSTRLVRCIDAKSYLTLLNEIYNYRKRKPKQTDSYEVVFNGLNI